MKQEIKKLMNTALEYFKRGSLKYIDFPDNLIEQYQAFTEAKITKIRDKGYSEKFLSLEEGVKSYLDWLSS